jgi:uncharacterized protein (DUF2141 family)
MKGFRYFLITVFIFCTTLIFAQSSLQVEVTELRNNEGQVSMELLDKDNEAVEGKTELIKDNKCIITFNNLKDGSYAIRYFHDENSNKKLDKKFIGIPKEGIGFSNDAYGKFGPKDFKHWLFIVEGKTGIKLITTYY